MNVPQLIGGALLVIVALRLGQALFVASRRITHERRRQALSLELLQARIEQVRRVRLPSAMDEPTWNGERKFEIVRKAHECEGVCSFYLAPHDGRPLPRFLPGQHLTFRFRIPGQSKPVIRCYSLSDCAHADQYRISVKRVPPPPDKPEAPAGLVSSFLHDQVEEGAIIDVRAPSGSFYLDMTVETPVVLIAGGIGVTPMMSMLNEVVETGSNREVWFFYAVRHVGEMMAREHLMRIAREHDNVRLVVIVGKAGPDDVAGEDYHHEGYLDLNLMKSLLPSNNFEFYICGPPPMMTAITDSLSEWGVPERSVHFEAFGPASVKRGSQAAPAQTDASFEVVFDRSGKRCTWTSESGSILDLAEAEGVALDFGCRAGSCGTCLTALKSGRITYLSEPGQPPEEGSCLACVAAPCSDVTLDA